MTKTILTIFLLFTGLFGYAQSYETVSYNLNGTPANAMKIKTTLPYTNGTQMVNIKIEGYCYGSMASIGLNIVYYIYNDVFLNHSVSSWGAYTPDIYLSNESGLVCITLADKPYYPRFKVSAFAKGMSAETAANFTGWTVVDEVAAGTNITLFPYKNVVKNLTITGTATAPTADPTTNNTQLATTAFVKAAITGIGGSYIQNSSAMQSSSNFNISGSGIMGRLGLSAIPASNIAIENATSLSGGASSYGFLNRGIVQSDVTSVAAYNRTVAQTVASPFTLSNIIHNYATQGTFGAGSTVSNQIGFWADASLIGGNNNYGFYGGIPSGANRYNLYMVGTANNFLAGNTTIGINDQSGQLSVRPVADAIKGIVAKGFSATQTGNLFEAQTSSAVQVFQISPNGSGTFAGSLAIGSQNTGVNFNNIKDLTGGTAAYGTVNQGVVQSDVTALASYNRTTARTAAGSFTVNQIIHNWATQGTFGAGSTVNHQYGFYAESNLVGATNNYGFFGNISAGGGRYNLYMNGTAQNYLSGPTSIGTGSVWGAQLATVPASDAIKGIVVKGFSGTQSANLQEWQASSGSILGYLSATGGMSASGGFVTPNNVPFSSLNTSGGTVTLIRYDGANRTIVGPNSEIQLSGGVAMGINGGAINLNGGVADGASAVGTTINTINAYSTAGAKILSIRNNGAEKAFFNKDGYLRTDRIGMGSVPSVTANLYMNSAITGSATAHGSLITATVNSDVVTSANVYNSFIGTQASAFTLGILRHYTAQQTTLGAGSSITTQVGFWADASLSGATNNRGFFGSVPSGSNNYNLFMNSGAFNYLQGNTGFGITPISSIKLRLNTGADENVGVEIRGNSAAQTANLTEWKNSSGVVLAAFTPLGVLAAPSVQNPVSANNGRIDLNSSGTVISRNVADAADVLTVTNASATSTGYIQNWKFGSVSRMALSGSGNLTLSTTPATSAGAYNILTHNSTTGAVEKIASSALNAPWTGVTGKPTTLSGYGITDGATSASVTAIQGSVTALDGNAVHKAGTETITGTKFLNGGVGISLSDPGKLGSYKLAVGGAVIAESMKVKPQTEWPDFVFEKDYPMLSLGDLEKFIIKNKHLPDVPSAAAVKKEGLDLGEMNAKLLQKIEELTLYLIEKDKEIKRLSEKDKEIKVLSEMVKELSEDIKAIKNKLNP